MTNQWKTWQRERIYHLLILEKKIIESGVDYSVYRENLKEDLITREIQRRVISQRIKISEKRNR